MIFGKKKKPVFEPELEESEVFIPTESRLEKAPWYIKFLFAIRIQLSTIDPMLLVLGVIGILWCILFAYTMLLPFAGTIADIPNKMPIMGGFTLVFLTWWFAGLYQKNIMGKRCVLSLDGQDIYVDNRKVETHPKSERLFLTNSYGNPLFNTDKDDPRRYMRQKCISIPKEVIEQFGSVRGHKAKAFSDCKIIDVAMTDVDYSIYYVPRHVSEEKLIKENDRLKLIHSIAIETINLLQADFQKSVKNIRGAERGRQQAMIEEFSNLRKAMYGSDEHIRQLMRQEMYRPDRFRRYGTYSKEQVNPRWLKYTDEKKESTP